jgi:hypothetical protein
MIEYWEELLYKQWRINNYFLIYLDHNNNHLEISINKYKFGLGKVTKRENITNLIKVIFSAEKIVIDDPHRR